MSSAHVDDADSDFDEHSTKDKIAALDPPREPTPTELEGEERGTREKKKEEKANEKSC